MTIAANICQTCGTTCFPRMFLCPNCHGNDFDTHQITTGKVEEIAVQHGSPALTFATVRSKEGPTIVARVDGTAWHGREVSFTDRATDLDGSTRFAYVPTATDKDSLQ